MFPFPHQKKWPTCGRTLCQELPGLLNLPIIFLILSFWGNASKFHAKPVFVEFSHQRLVDVFASNGKEIYLMKTPLMWIWKILEGRKISARTWFADWLFCLPGRTDGYLLAVQASNGLFFIFPFTIFFYPCSCQLSQSVVLQEFLPVWYIADIYNVKEKNACTTKK